MEKQKPNPAKDKSYTFALRIVKLYRHLCENKKEYTLSKQLVRSGTSIGANVEEAIGAQSKKEFVCKCESGELLRSKWAHFSFFDINCWSASEYPESLLRWSDSSSKRGNRCTAKSSYACTEFHYLGKESDSIGYYKTSIISGPSRCCRNRTACSTSQRGSVSLRNPDQ